MSLQNFPWNKVGSLSERPTASKTQEGYLFLDRDTGFGYFLSINPTTQVHSWVQFSVGGAAGLSSKYWVNRPGSIPAVAYTTIQSAIDAAVTDGHSAADPAVVFVLPGTYAENLTIPAGISIHGFSMHGFTGGVTITGEVVLNGTTGGLNSLENLVIAGDLLHANGGAGAAMTFTLDQVEILASGKDAIHVTSNSLTLIATNCTFSVSLSGSGILSDTAGNTFVLTNCTLIGTGAAKCAAIVNAGVFQASSCTLKVVTAGTNVFSDTGAGAHIFWGCRFQGAVGGSYFAGGATVQIHDSFVPSNCNVLITGGTAITHYGSPYLGAYTVANLPAMASITSGDGGAPRAFATNGRKVGEGGPGTGVPLYGDDAAWRVYSTDAAVVGP